MICEDNCLFLMLLDCKEMWGLWSYLTGALEYLGLYKKSGKLVFLGLDNAGKTSLLHVLTQDLMAQPGPTHYPTSEELSIAGIGFVTFDLGGHEQARRVWKTYFPAVDGVVFIVDAIDRARCFEIRLVVSCFVLCYILKILEFLFLVLLFADSMRRGAN